MTQDQTWHEREIAGRIDGAFAHSKGYNDHYLHCLTRCVPELLEKLPAVKRTDVSRDEVRELLAEWRASLISIAGFHPNGQRKINAEVEDYLIESLCQFLTRHGENIK